MCHAISFDFLTALMYIDVASGGSIDWTYDTEGVLYSYALELRDTGLYG